MKKAKLSPELLRKIKDSVNIVEVIGEHVVLRKSGANYVGLCPFHSERTPSFSVSENKQLYHCYGCKKGGDLVSFVMEILGMNFPEAIEDLADRSKVALPQDWEDIAGDPEAQKEQRKADSLRREKQALSTKLNRFAAAFYHQSLTQHSKAQDYFRVRGVGADLIKSFYLGASMDSWDALSSFLVAKKAPLDLAVELGLIRPSTKTARNTPGQLQGPGYFDLFRNRVMFPIVNLRGKIAGFGGRVLGSDTPKYLNSPDSLLFQKGKLAFGLFQAQKFIREKDEIILVEGYFDVLAMHAAGFQNVVATCGTALTADHLAIFKRLASRVTILFDGDEAGVTATSRAMETGLEKGWVLHGAKLPEGVDPDEILFDLSTGSSRVGGVEQMSQILKQATPLLDEKLDETVRLAHRSPEDRVQALKKMGGWLGRFRDPVGREVRVQWIQKQLGLSDRVMQEVLAGSGHAAGHGVGRVESEKKIASVSVRPSSLSSVTSSVPSFASAKSMQKKPSAASLSPLDRVLLGGLVFGKEYLQAFTEYKAALPPDTDLSELFDYPAARAFVARLMSDPEFFDRFTKVPDTLIGEDLDIQVSAVLTESLLWTQPPFSLADLREAVFKNMGRIWARFSQRIKVAIREAELRKDAELQAQLMKDYLDVQRKMKDFTSFYDQE